MKNTNSIKSRKPNQVKQTGQKKPPPIRDARLKIIQKNRQKLKDARDKLAEIAKQGDARSKLDKLRGKNQNQRQAMTVTQISKGITLKKGRNGQISLSTNKKQNNSLNQRRISNLGHTRFPNPQGIYIFIFIIFICNKIYLTNCQNMSLYVFTLALKIQIQSLH